MNKSELTPSQKKEFAKFPDYVIWKKGKYFFYKEKNSSRENGPYLKSDEVTNILKNKI